MDPNMKLSFKSGCLVVIGIFVVAAIGAGLFANLTSDKNSAPVKSDKELFTAYYSEMMAKIKDADQIYAPFADTLGNGDIVGATQIALRIKQPINSKWSEISNIKVPNLRNQEAKQKLDKAHEALSNCYLYKSSIVSDFIDYADAPSIKKMAEIKTSAEKIQTYMLGGMAAMIEAGDKAGITQEEFKAMLGK